MAHIKPKNRLKILGALFAIAFLAISVQLGMVQLVETAEWRERVHQGRQIVVRTPAIRGFIRDRNNVILADNRPSYDVDLYLPEIVEAHKNRRQEAGERPLTVEEARRIEGVDQLTLVPDIVEIVRRDVLPRLEAQGLVYTLNEDRLRRHAKRQLHVPYTLGEDLDFDEIAQFLEKSLDIPGVEVTSRPVRRYIYDSMLAQIIGYVGKPRDVSKEPDVDNYNFYQPDQIGIAGLERLRDNQLRGSPGRIVRVTDVKGRGVREEVYRTEATQGSDIYLTIDSRVQAIAEEAMRAVGRGSCVVLDPNNGDVLAMVSVPSYNPNTFLGISRQNWDELTRDPAHPMTNRAISTYSPGSTYKIVISLSGMTSDTGDQYLGCGGYWTFGNGTWRCWREAGHGYLHMDEAIKVSCNCYYYEYANRVGIDELLRVGALLGLGEPTGLEVVGEDPGILPGPQILEVINERLPPRERMRWNRGATANIAIGQGQVQISPMQMAVVVAAVANGGKVLKPRLIREVVPQADQSRWNDPTWQGPPVETRTDLMDHGLTPERLEKIRLGMWKVVNESGGTGRAARHPELDVAGKTGTVQVPHRKDINDAWFIAFVPYENPTLALAIQVENGKSGGGVGAPIANKIITEVTELRKTPFYDLKPLQPARGHFDFIEKIDFDLPQPAVRTAPPTDEPEGTDPNTASEALDPQRQPPESPTPEQLLRSLRNPAFSPDGQDEFFNPTPDDASAADDDDDARSRPSRRLGGRRR
jgi:penicillin-binding protein 2